ncbi:hypothetical protein [Caudoviricetes sp.]|nr:hypothetical protein [Caudoviricetes sp.]
MNKYIFADKTRIMFTETGETLEQVCEKLDLIISEVYYSTAIVKTKYHGVRLAVHWSDISANCPHCTTNKV